MGWIDRLRQTAEKAAAEAGDMAAIGKLKLEVRTLHGKMEDAFKAIGAKVYDLSETGTLFPEEVGALCQKADAFADEIKAKEAQIEQLKAAGSS